MSVPMGTDILDVKWGARGEYVAGGSQARSDADNGLAAGSWKGVHTWPNAYRP